jgi:hypothetical protein
MANDDTDGLAQQLATKAALLAGRDAAQAALDGLLLSDDEKAARAAARARATKKKLVLAVVVATVGAVGVIALLQLIAQLWLWAIGAVIVAGVVGVAALLLRPRLEAVRQRLTAGRAAADAERAAAAEQQRQRQALAAAAQAQEQTAKKLENELARLKQQAGR